MARTKSLTPAKASHSVRVTDQSWEAARRRAEMEGTTVNGVVSEIIDGYGRGLIDLPKIIKQYKKASTKPVVVSETAD